MKKTVFAATATCAFGLASPAYAEPCTGTAGANPYATAPVFIDCEQYAQINGGNASAVAAYNAGFDAVGYTGPDLTWAKLEPTKTFFTINGDEISFEKPLSGQQFFAIHFGSAGGGGGSGNQTLFYQFNFASPTSKLDLNRMGYSNAIGVLSISAVPEASTWAMMLFGFGGVGFAMRRRRQLTAPRAVTC